MRPVLVCRECGVIPDSCSCSAAIQRATPLVTPRDRARWIDRLGERFQVSLGERAA